VLHEADIAVGDRDRLDGHARAGEGEHQREDVVAGGVGVDDQAHGLDLPDPIAWPYRNSSVAGGPHRVTRPKKMRWNVAEHLVNRTKVEYGTKQEICGGSDDPYRS
jgi:hypothetical protein